MPNANDHALVVGINVYNSFESLDGAVNDANNFYRWLTSSSGGDVPAANIKLIVSNGLPGKPSKSEIEDEIGKWVERYKTDGLIGRRLYVFLAGHGINVGYLEDCGLLTADASDVFTDRSVPGRRLATAFKQAGAFRQVVLFMDCCREIVMQNPSGDMELLRLLPPVPGAISHLLWGLATHGARSAGERVLPDPYGDGEQVQGVFSYALIDGLRRAGDINGVVTGTRLKDYVQQHMTRLTGMAQPPDIDFKPADIVIASPGQGVTAVFVTLACGQPDFDVRDGGDYFQRMALVPAPVGNGTFRLSLPPGLYLFGRPAGRDVRGYDVKQDVTVVGEEVRVEL